MKAIFLIGYMGSGKTTIGKALAKHLNISFLDMDHHIEKKYSKTVSQIFEEFGQERFREIERDNLHEIADIENVIIATGGGTPCFFDNIDYMNEHGLTVYIQLSIAELVFRLENSTKGKRPLLSDKKGDELSLFIEDGLAKRTCFYEKAMLKVSGNDLEIIDTIEKYLDASLKA